MSQKTHRIVIAPALERKAPKTPPRLPPNQRRELYKDNLTTGGFPPEACRAPCRKMQQLRLMTQDIAPLPPSAMGSMPV